MASILTSYDLKGKKDSFANWISNLSPTDTFFVSTTGKEQVKNTLFQWQTDNLAAADKTNAHAESTSATTKAITSTTVLSNKTQILRKVVEVTDTADVLDNWGRGRELAYQMEKAGKEIKRDLEAILLSDQKESQSATPRPSAGNGTTADAKAEPAYKKEDGSSEAAKAGEARKTACFQRLVGSGATGDTAQADTGAKVVMKVGTADKVTEAELFEMTYNLYLAGADADIIMFHPKHASFFSSLMETGPVGATNGRIKLIDNMDTTLNKFVGNIVDPLGQQYKLVPNRWMPTDAIYIFNPKDWTQMVLREPQKVKLAKKGSSERYMIEMEVGLRHRNPFASGVIVLKTALA